jgi:exodeoxyribonuclease V alpha subunit
VKVSATVTISAVHPGPSGGAVFSGHDSAGTRLRFIADRDRIFRAPVVGEAWSLQGEIRSHPKYGDQLHVARASLVEPAGRLIVDFLLKHPAFDGLGIGKAKAARLWTEFGSDLHVVLDTGDVGKLSDVLPEDSAQKLVEAWHSVTEEASVVSFLDQHGFDLRLANRVRRVWPENTLAKLIDNPYRMLAFADWEKVDRAARSLGVAQNDPRRRIAAVEACLYRRLDAKHTLTPREMLLEGVCGVMQTRSLDVASAAVEQALSEQAIVTTADGYQPLGTAVMERVVADRLREISGGAPGSERNLFSTNLTAITAETIASFETSVGLKLNAGQRRAVEMAIHQPFGVLTGGAGTGKTTVLQVIHRIAEQTGVPVLQMALSGRAAQRMRQATSRPASTIAAFLRIAERRNLDPDSEPLVIIDESSMLDLPLIYSVVRTMPTRARLLLVGDPYQLPPIGFGLVFSILATSPNTPRVELVEVHRQAQSSGIPQVAHQIRRGIVPSLSPFAGTDAGVSFIEAGSGDVMNHILRVRTEWSQYDDVQVLGVTRRGTTGIRNINVALHAAASGRKSKLDGWEFAEGAPIIYLVNDYQKELWNGSLGRIEKIVDSDGRRSLLCSLDGVPHEIPAEEWHRIDLAYAITVHKAQGSQFKRVIVPISASRLLDRTLIYTALTRGMEQVVFIGDRNAFDAAVTAPPHSHERQVGFSM